MNRADSRKQDTRRTLRVGNTDFCYFALDALEARRDHVRRLPKSLKVFLENLLRHDGGDIVTADAIAALASWSAARHSEESIPFFPARVLMPDSSGIPLLADFAAMRDAVLQRGGDPEELDSVLPVDVVVDHAVIAEFFGDRQAAQRNLEFEYAQNRERYTFLRWAQQAFHNLRVVPPGKGIMHQINLEYLAQPIRSKTVDGLQIAYPDSLVGTDSHTPMINALGVVGWGVGGIEAGSVMLGEAITLKIPDVVGCRLRGRLRPGATAMDLVLLVTETLRARGVVGKIVEFTGQGGSSLPLADRATLSNMAAEYGATMGFFPIDSETLRYLSGTGRSRDSVALTESYARAQGLWADVDKDVAFSDLVDINLDDVEPSMAGPSRPQERHPLWRVPESFRKAYPDIRLSEQTRDESALDVRDGDVVIAAISSCTNTSNPSGMIGAGLLARNAVRLGLKSKPWVKTSLSPGSRTVTDYLKTANLLQPLEQLGFFISGYGCMTCGGGSGALIADVANAVDRDNLVVASVLSANRNFEGRTHPQTRATYLGSPAMVVVYALTGSLLVNFESEPIGRLPDGKDVYLKDVWPDDDELQKTVASVVKSELFETSNATMLTPDELWKGLSSPDGSTFPWDGKSTYFCRPPFFDPQHAPDRPEADIENARTLLLLGDSITTDHISPCSPIPVDGPAGKLLLSQGVIPSKLHNYEARRVNHHVMTRGTFANIRLRNQLVPELEGGMTRHFPSGDVMTVYDAAVRYESEGVPLVVIAGDEYGTGSSRDWAAKGTKLLGIRAVVAEGFERIHRSNLVGMGVLPLQFLPDTSWRKLGIDGSETVSLSNIDEALSNGAFVMARFKKRNGEEFEIPLRCRVDTSREAEWYRHGGVLSYVLTDRLLKQNTAHGNERLAQFSDQSRTHAS